MSDMEEKLKKYCTVISGYAFKSQDLSEGTDIPIIKIGNISNGENISLDNSTQYVNKEFLFIGEKYHVLKGDILISLTGSHMNQPNSMVGRCCRNLDDVVYLLNQRAGKVIPKKTVNKDFLYYVFRLKSIQYAIANRAYGGANQVNVSPQDIMGIKFRIPNFTVQNRIVDILITYDKLIENNNKRIKLLEQMAENLYKEWFVRFRFPGYEHVEFIDGFPKEWKICRIDQLSKIKAGGDAPDDSTKEITDECSIPIYSNGIENEGLYGYTSKVKINKPSITISARGTVGYTCLRRVSYTPIVRLICIIPHEEKLANWLFYYFKRTIVIANGTSQQQITIPMMSREKVLLPTNNLIQNFYEYSTCYLDEIDSLKAQNSNLTKQRDMLLPRLMSGKLEV